MTKQATEVEHRPSIDKTDAFVETKDVEAGFTDIDDGFDPALIKRTVRKADWRLIPMLSAMYCISLIDRSNLSIARSANDSVMNKQLHLDKGNHYSIATLVFFIAYIILEIPVGHLLLLFLFLFLLLLRLSSSSSFPP